MRVLIVVVVLMAILALVGWIRFSSPDGDPTIGIDSEKIRQDTSTIVDKSREVTNDAVQNLDMAAEKVDASIDREPIK